VVFWKEMAGVEEGMKREQAGKDTAGAVATQLVVASVLPTRKLNIMSREGEGRGGFGSSLSTNEEKK